MNEFMEQSEVDGKAAQTSTICYLWSGNDRENAEKDAVGHLGTCEH
jgi:hypothetical protein